MALRLHRAERADVLVGGLATVLAEPPEDPFSEDLVAVPSQGVERWIAQSLSTSLGAGVDGEDGVCANIGFPSPARVVSEAVATACGIAPDDDPWAERRLPWALLEVVDGCVEEDWCRALGRHLGVGAGRADQGRRVATAQKLAGLFTSYGAQRPSMLRGWARGEDTDGFGADVDDDLLWQPELWRRLRAAAGVESPAERVLTATARLRDAPGLVHLPARLSLFGATRLTADQVEVLSALAAHRDIDLWLPHPSGALWDAVAATGPGLTARRQDPTGKVPHHPLLVSCGRDARELQLRLCSTAQPDVDEHLALPPDDPGALLGALQGDVREDREPRGVHRLADGDRSVQVHACHGRQRQVEVLREVLLGLLEEDPTLEPRDIVVMCPDIESYAPLISAAFGLEGLEASAGGDRAGGDRAGGDRAGGDGAGSRIHPGHRLRVRLADRALRQTNPVLAVVARLLELADARLTVTEVLDLAAMPAVRARFGFDDDELELLGDWVRRSGVRWGLDASARAPYHLETVPQNTWRAGLDRVLVGVAMDEEELRAVGMALPLDDVDSNEVDLAGRLAELIERLGRAVETLSAEQTLDGWIGALLAAVDELTWAPPFDAWQTSEARRQLTDVLLDAGGHANTVPLLLSDVRALLGHRLRGRPTRANFRTGWLTMCTMVPMRSVPHRVVCLLGLDDGVFPRAALPDGDDVLARDPRVGERDVRSEDRQLFLDAVLAARERLVVLYSGADEHTGAERPPAVPLGELLDVLDRTAAVGDGTVRDRVLVRHPLQPFDGRNFAAGRLGVRGPFSFDAAAYDGARAMLGERSAAAPFLTAPLVDDGQADTVELDALVAFLEHPAKAFVRRRLGLAALADEDQPADTLPVELDALEAWQVGERLLTARLAGVPRDRAVRAEWLRGQLPPGPLGGGVVDAAADEVEVLVQRTGDLRAGEPTAVDVAVQLPGGCRLAGTVPWVHGDVVVRVTFSRLAAKHRLRAWVQLLALAAADPEQPWTTATAGRGRRKGTFAISRATRPDAGRAAAALDDLVALYRLGRRQPLPLSPRTSCCYAEKRRSGSPPGACQAKASTEWRRSFDGRDIGEHDDVDHRRVWGDAPFEALLGEPARADLAWPDEDSLFGQLARIVWQPLLDAESVSES